MAHPIWPLFDLEVRTPRITMRYVDDDLATQLSLLAAGGVHDPSTMPFAVPWTDVPSPELERNTLRYHWEQRTNTQPSSWHLHLAVLVDDEVIGTSALLAADFGILRAFETGSWLGRGHQGQGYGKEMRRASLALGFNGFDALTAHTGAWQDNAASLGVTRSLGYEEEGRRILRRRNERDVTIGFSMDRAGFERLDTADVDLIGVDTAREFLEIG